MSTFTAKYASGTCTECDSPIKPGDEISRTAADGFLHAECPESELDAFVGKPACPSCWIIGPCDCE